MAYKRDVDKTAERRAEKQEERRREQEERQVAQDERRAVRRKKQRRVRNITIAVLLVGLALFFAIRFYYPFGTGVKTGQLNYVVYKGVVFKTYEGKLVQSGFQSDASGGLQSNQFVFSVADKAIAERLMHAGGQVVELHYKEYFGALPWRGYSKYIVDEIINIVPSSAPATESVPPVYSPQ